MPKKKFNQRNERPLWKNHEIFLKDVLVGLNKWRDTVYHVHRSGNSILERRELCSKWHTDSVQS